MTAAKFVIELESARGRADYSPVVGAALVLAAIVSYGRPFTKSFSSGLAAAKVDVEATGVFDAHPELRALHDRMLDLRNRAVAHSDWEFHRALEHPDGRHVLTYDLANELKDTAALKKLITAIAVNCIGQQYALDGKADPWQAS